MTEPRNGLVLETSFDSAQQRANRLARELKLVEVVEFCRLYGDTGCIHDMRLSSHPALEKRQRIDIHHDRDFVQISYWPTGLPEDKIPRRRDGSHLMGKVFNYDRNRSICTTFLYHPEWLEILYCHYNGLSARAAERNYNFDALPSTYAQQIFERLRLVDLPRLEQALNIQLLDVAKLETLERKESMWQQVLGLFHKVADL